LKYVGTCIETIKDYRKELLLCLFACLIECNLFKVDIDILQFLIILRSKNTFWRIKFVIEATFSVTTL